MKLILGSAPEGKKVITQKIVELVGKPQREISVCVINECWVAGSTDIGILINGLAAIKHDFGGTIHLVNMFSQSMDEVLATIDKADFIWCFGGDTNFLKNVFDRTGFTKKLPGILANKLWVGSSAGSHIIGRKTSEKSDQGVYKTKMRHETEKYLEFVDFGIFAHVHESYARKDAFDAVVAESKEQSFPIYALSDESAIVIDGSKQPYLIGKNAQKLENGKVTETI